MKKLFFLTTALALVLGMSQCRKPDLSSGHVGKTQTIEFTTSYNGGAKGELIDATTALNYKWDDDASGDGKTDKLYVYAQDGGTTFTSGTFIGVLPIVEVTDGGYKAKFSAELEGVPASGVLRFVHYGQGVTVNANGVASVDFSTQQVGTPKEISKYVIAMCDKAYNGGTVFDNCALEVQFAIAKLQFVDFGSGNNITVSGMSATGLRVATTGVISNINGTSLTLNTPGTGAFCTVFIPKGSSTYKFSSPAGVANAENWAFVANKYYTKGNGSEQPTGNPVVIEASVYPYIPGDFTVNKSTGKKVNFAKGNLYYDGTEPVAADRWKLEANQWDYRTWAGAQCYISGTPATTATPTNHCGLFKWGNPTEAIDGTTTAPTGEFFAASGFPVEGETWFTLSYDEWRNLLGLSGGTSPRDNASSLRGWRTVAGVPGLVILPDGSTTSLSSITTAEQLAAAGAVFLPAAAGRYGTSVGTVGSSGYYWSSDLYTGDASRACHIYFDSMFVYPSTYGYGRDNGLCVRLVR